MREEDLEHSAPSPSAAVEETHLDLTSPKHSGAPGGGALAGDARRLLSARRDSGDSDDSDRGGSAGGGAGGAKGRADMFFCCIST